MQMVTEEDVDLISLMQWYMVILHESDTCTGADTSSIPQDCQWHPSGTSIH